MKSFPFFLWILDLLWYHALLNIEDVTDVSDRMHELRNLKNEALPEVESRKRLEMTLIEEKEKAEKATKLKQDFWVRFHMRLEPLWMELLPQLVYWKILN